MRIERLSILGACLAAGLHLVAGCGGTNTGDMAGTVDMAVARPDMATVPDLTMVPDIATVPDLVVTYSANLIVEDVLTTIPVPMGDAGVQQVPARIILPVVAMGVAGATKHDFNDNLQIGGCFSDHYNISAGKLPNPDSDAGTVIISGYTMDQKTLDGRTAPNEIDCAIVKGFYQCGYGPLMNGAPGMNTAFFPFPAQSTPFSPGKAIRFRYSGGKMLGTYDSMSTVTASETIGVTEDLSRIKYSTSADTVLHLTCPDGMNGKCPAGLQVALVQIVVSQKPVGDPMYPGNEFGKIFCTGIVGGGTVTVKGDAFKAAIGGSAAITQVASIVVRGNFPPNAMDSNGNGITVAVGRGVLAYAAYP